MSPNTPFPRSDGHSLSASTAAPNIDDVHADLSQSNNDPFKFSHGLTGVDQIANYLFVNILVITIFTIVFLAIFIRIATAIQHERRRVSMITASRYEFWRNNRRWWWTWTKRHVMYAPIWGRRHNSELRVTKAISIGTLPTRLQLVTISIYTASNIAYCLAVPNQPQAQRIAELRGRCGALAVFNMIPTILFALRNNPFIWILHISYDTFNLFHRWTARIVFAEAVVHVVAWAYNTYHVDYDGMGGWASVNWVLSQSLSYRWGLTAIIAFAFLVLHSFNPLRHAFYESFLTLHRLSIIVAISGIYYHMAKHALPQLPWAYLFITLLILEPVIRTIRLLSQNLSLKRRTWTTVTLEPLPGNATKVTFDLPKPWTGNPGSHIHIYIPRLALWSSHPFSVAWSTPSVSSSLTTEKVITSSTSSSTSSLTLAPTTQTPLPTPNSTKLSCIIRARTGLTHHLHTLSQKSQNTNTTLYAAIEGPYGGSHTLTSYGTILLFAAGVGITHQLPYLRYLVAGRNNHTAAAQKVVLVWCVQCLDQLTWIEGWLDDMAEQLPGYEDVVRVRVYVSKGVGSSGGDSGDGEARRLPPCVEVRSGRCDAQTVVDEEVREQVGAMVVSVCGPGGFADDVRDAVRRRIEGGGTSVDFLEEGFSY